MRLASSRGGIELLERVFQMLIDLHYGGLVATTVAVVGSAEDGNDLQDTHNEEGRPPART